MDYVKVIYKKDAASEEAVLINGSSVVTLKEFILFVETKKSQMNRQHSQFDVDFLCKNGYSVKEAVYGGVEKWYEKFISFYNLP